VVKNFWKDYSKLPLKFSIHNRMKDTNIQLTVGQNVYKICHIMWTVAIVH